MKKKSLSAKKIIHKKILSHLNNKRILNNYTQFKKNINKYNNYNKLSGAISGGPDSMALAFFLKCYEIEKGRKVYFYHIDHGLRASSKIEANKIKQKLKFFEINLKVIRWISNKTKNGNLQSIARSNRYRLLFNQMKLDKSELILTGHTRNDLIENFFLRVFRGSGLKGFVSFNELNNFVNGKIIFRPFLDTKKSELQYISKQVFGSYIEDPSNKNPIFKRTKVRNMIEEFSDQGLDLDKISLTINNLSEANRAIKYYIKQNIKHNVKKTHKKNFLILNSHFFENPLEISLRSLLEILSRLGGKYYPPRGKKVVKIIKEILNQTFKKSTLHGCIIEKFGNLTLIYKENEKKI